MPLLKRANAGIHYETSGSGEPVILLHGFSVNSTYWSQTGVFAALAGRYRAIVMDLRGHGHTVVEGEPRGFDAATLAADIAALADALGIGPFHLVGHSMGGMVALRYALRRDARLASLSLLGTSPATDFGHHDARLRRQALLLFSALYEEHDWDGIFAHLRRLPGPLLYRMDQSPQRELLWAMLQSISRSNDPRTLAAFVRSFYTDSDPPIEELRRIACPTLILVGEHDKLFLRSSALLAQEIPGACYLMLPGIGHMTALEAPALTSQALLTFSPRRRVPVRVRRKPGNGRRVNSVRIRSWLHRCAGCLRLPMEWLRWARDCDYTPTRHLDRRGSGSSTFHL